MMNMPKYAYLAFALFILISAWEQGKSDAAITSGAIPEESIRLRILAHSDRLEDQWIKRKVRDEIIAHMEHWVDEPASIEEARKMVEERLPEFRYLIEQTLKKYGFPYGYDVMVGEVDFPAKMYGKEIYPAGKYEALRVTLGEGKGENWWCVLFPPLCFVDVVSGEAVPKDAVEISSEQPDSSEANDAEPELRFFVVDLFKSLFRHLSNLFA